MKDILEGVQTCPSHGEFAWKTIVLSGHMERAFGWWNRMRQNVKRTVRLDDMYVITVECPVCGKRFVIEHKSNVYKESREISPGSLYINCA